MVISKSDSAVYKLNSLLGLILEITDTVYSGLESKAGSYRMLPSQTTGRYDDGADAFRDNLYMSAAITDNDIIAIFTSIFAVKGTREICKVELGASGELTLTGESINMVGMNKQNVETPSLAIREFAAITALVQDGVTLTRIVAETVTASIAIAKGADAKKQLPEEL
ncbi:hypothetical protein LQZ19_01885 [Treponema primitia]|uniref:hypothetical protein n=1 Tax=Treponema primitia TaxID=88058 RepID=UPI0039817C07